MLGGVHMLPHTHTRPDDNLVELVLSLPGLQGLNSGHQPWGANVFTISLALDFIVANNFN